MLIGRRVFNRGGRLLPFPVGNQAYLSSIIRFTRKVINKEAIETGFPCIPTIKKTDGGGKGAHIRGGVCLIFWPKRWALIREWKLIQGYTVYEKNTSVLRTKSKPTFTLP